MPPAPGAPAAVAAAPVGYLGLLRSREYAGLLVSRVVSLVGDQLARVALTVLVFERTDSALLSALTYAATFLPVVLGGPLLGGLADRLPRRRLLVVADLLRAALFALMAVPGLPLLLLLLLVMLASLVEAPWAAARTPVLRQVLVDDDAYQRGSALDEALEQGGQVLGFVAAGALLLVLEPGTALLLDAATFLLSALVVRTTLRERPAAAAGSAARGSAGVGLRAAFAPGARRPLLLTCLALSLSVAPEALAVPLAAQWGGGTAVAGLLFAATPAGVVVGTLALARVPTPAASRLLGPLALLSAVPLLGVGLRPPLPLLLALLALAGALSGFSLLARVAFVSAVPDELRGRAFAVASSAIVGGQGIGIALAGLLAAWSSPAAAVSGTAALAVVSVALVLLLDRAPNRTNGSAQRPSRDSE